MNACPLSTRAGADTLPGSIRAAALALAAAPEHRDFAFTADLSRAAWIVEDRIEWDDGPDRPLRSFTPGGALPDGTHLELVSPTLTGVCRSTDAGVELLAVDHPAGAGSADGGTDVQGAPTAVRPIASFLTPRTCLLPRLPGVVDQILAVGRFDGTSVLCRIHWDSGDVGEVGRLPFLVTGGVWLVPGQRMAVNLTEPEGRSSVYAVDVDEGRFNLLFEASPASEDRIVLCDQGSRLAVFTTDAFAYPAVGIARLGDAGGVRFLPPITGGDEAGAPCAFVTTGGRLRVLLRHEQGASVRLRLADPETMTISEPLEIPDGELGSPVAACGTSIRFPFSTSDQPWITARLDLDGGRFRLERRRPPDDGRPSYRSGRATTWPGPTGPMPGLVVDPDPAFATGDLTAVALHGGPIARFGAEWKGEVQLLARLGLPVVGLDYPGSTGWGQGHMRALFGAAGAVDVEAVTTVVDALYAEGRHTVLYGESYGAFLALLVAAARPAAVAGVVALAPFASFSRMKQTGRREVREMLELLDRKNSVETGRNALKACRNIRCRVLIIHGTTDHTIPVGESRALAQALRERKGAGEDDVRIVELENQGHELTGQAALTRSYLEIARFVAGLQSSRSPAQWRHQQQGH